LVVVGFVAIIDLVRRHRSANIAATVRAALKVRAASAPDWLPQQVPAKWYARYGRRRDDDVVPAGQAARHA
jgi:hypothetical protein